MSGKVFISYRREADTPSACRIYESMATRFGPNNVFFDLNSIPGGAPWKQQITESLHAAAALVIVIGPKWAEVLESRQQSDIEDEHLFEIETAFALRLHVVPILLDNTPMPRAEELPPQIRKQLPARNAMSIQNDGWWNEKLRKIIDDLESILGTQAPDSGGARNAGAAELTVGPRGSDADFYEIADAIASAQPGTRVRVAAGNYRKPLVIDRNVEIFAEGPDVVTLESQAAPCVHSTASDASIIGVGIRSTSSESAAGIVVSSGTLHTENCTIESEWPEEFVGFEVSGDETKAVLEDCRVHVTKIGIHFSGCATGRVENTTIEAATHHAVRIDNGADPQLLRCTFEGAGHSTLLIADGGKGDIADCAIGRVGRAGKASIEIRSGGDPNVRGPIVGGGAGASARVQTRERLSRLVERESGRPATEGWHVDIHDGGNGRFRSCDLAVLKTTTGASPKIGGCRVDTFDASDGGLGELTNCNIGSVNIMSTANPLITGGSTIHPDRGGPIAVSVTNGGLGTIEDSEIIGINVDRRTDDPAVLIDTSGDPTLVGCAVTGPEPGTIVIADRGRGRIERCEITTEARGGPAIVFQSTVNTFTISDSKIHGGASVETRATVEFRDCKVDAPKLGTTGLTVHPGGVAHLYNTHVSDTASHGIVVAGHATLQDCDIESTGESAIIVEDSGRLLATECTISGAGTSATQRVGRRLSALSERVKERADKLIGSSPAVAVRSGGSAEFIRCAVNDERDEAIEVAPQSTIFHECTLNRRPYDGHSATSG